MKNSPPNFHDDLKREVERTLEKASILAIGSFGWLNEYEPDPEYIGHAMWHIDAPRLDVENLFEEGPVRQRPKDIEKEILTTGEDFWGLMEASRLSIGLALVWKKKAKENPINESTFFWLHHTDAFLKLAIASDRLRDLLIIACTWKRAKTYKKKRKRPFSEPFETAAALIQGRKIDDEHLTKLFPVLPGLATALVNNRRRRNKIVHEIATQMAAFTREAVSKLQKRYDAQQDKSLRQPVPRLPFPERAKQRRKEIQAEIEAGADELRNWYMLLIEASNIIFQIEYWTRRRSAHY